MPGDQRSALADFVAAVGPAELSAVELAEALWLAARISEATPAGAGAPAPDRGADEGPRPPHRVPVSIPAAAGDQPPDGPASPDPAMKTPDQEAGDDGLPRGDRQSPATTTAPIRVPPPAGTDAIRYARALRGLRPVPARRPARAASSPARVDEAQTARFAAETGLLWPVPESRRPRRGVAKVVVDRSVSMQVWAGLEDDVVNGLALSRIFRRVELWSLSRRDDGAAVVTGLGSASGPERPLARLADRSGDGAVLILSDGVSALWYRGDAAAAARTLAAACPVAVVQPLPNRLWRRTGLRPRLATVAGTTRGLEAFHLARIASEGATPAVPIIEAADSWLAAWASLASGRLSSGRFAVLGASTPGGAPAPDPIGLGAREAGGPNRAGQAVPAVRRFRAAASQGARELAVALSVVPLSLPVMQMVLAACFPGRSRAHLAEVITGGLMQRDPASRGSGGPPAFRWLPGVGEELRREVNDRRAEEVRAALSSYLDSELGFRSDARGFPAVVGAPGAEAGREGPAGTAFAEVLPDTAERALNLPAGAATAGTVSDTQGHREVARQAARALDLARKARETGRSADIDEAIEAARPAVSEAAAGDWAVTTALVDLLDRRRRGSGAEPDLEEAAVILRAYADRAPSDDPHRRECLERLADVLLARYEATESPDLLEDVIRVRRELAEGEDAPQEQVVLLADSLLEHHRLTGSSLSVYEATDLISGLRQEELSDGLRASATVIRARGLDVMSRSTRAEEDIEAADAQWLALMADLGALPEREADAARSAIEERIRFHRSSGRAERARALEAAFARAGGRPWPAEKSDEA